MKKYVLFIFFIFKILSLTAQKPFISTFVDSVNNRQLYFPFKIDTILSNPPFTKVGWYNNVLKLEKEKKFDEAFAIIEPKKNTDPLASYLLGKYFYLNLSSKTPKEKSSAFLWFHNASNQNFPPALEASVMMIVLREHNQKDSVAIGILKKAQKEGLKNTNGKIAYIFHQSTQFKNNLDSAFYYYKKAIGENDKEAIHNLGALYEDKKEFELMLKQYNEGSQKGLNLSNRRLGEIYYTGTRVPKDLDKAQKYFEKCSSLEGACNNYLGLLSIRSRNYTKAFEYFTKSVQLNDIFGKYNFAVYLSEGLNIGVDNQTEEVFFRRDPQKAHDLYKSVSDFLVQAENNIGTLYERGMVENNKAEAKKWYERAASKENIHGMLNLGRLLNKEDSVTAIKWIEKAANTNNFDAISYHIKFVKSQSLIKGIQIAEKYTNHPNINVQRMAMRTAGDYNRQRAESLKKNDSEKNKRVEDLLIVIGNKAIDWYNKAAKLNDDSSMVRLGQIYYFGNIIKKDFSKVEENWKSAAKLNNATAMYNLAYFYEKDTTLYKTKKYVEAAEYYKKTIEYSKKELKKVAAFRLGNLYQYVNFKDFEKNSKEALKYYTIAADLGDDDAMYEIGYIYEHGSNTPRIEYNVKANINEAEKWYKKAAFLKNEDAINALKKMGK